MFKVMSVVGARPNFMKVAPIHRAFKKYSDRVVHKIVHTGQHYDAEMSDAFFADLDMPQPDYFLGVGSASHAVQTAKIMVEFEKILKGDRPDLIIVVGDVNSTVACSLTAVKMGIAVAHVEGGLRSFDRTMPEEINRMATDAICDYCFITEQSALENLTNQAFPAERIFFVGNTMIDSLHYAAAKAKASGIVGKLNLTPDKFVLLTIHRPSNVDDPVQLAMLLDVFDELSANMDLVFPIHPRTRKNLEKFGLAGKAEKIKRLKLIHPLGYIEFLSLMQACKFVMTDSGGIQEETTALRKPCITLRTSTERPVTCEIGTNILVYPDYENIKKALDDIKVRNWDNAEIPRFWDGKAAGRIADVIVNKIFIK